MLNNECQAGTAVDNSTTADVTTSSHSIGNTNVASSFSLSTPSQHPSTFAAYKMLQQLDEKKDGSSHWMLMSLCKLLYERPNLLVKELINELEILCPNAAKSVTERMTQQGLLS